LEAEISKFIKLMTRSVGLQYEDVVINTDYIKTIKENPLHKEKGALYSPTVLCLSYGDPIFVKETVKEIETMLGENA